MNQMLTRCLGMLTLAFGLCARYVAPVVAQASGASSGLAYAHKVWTVDDGLPVNAMNDLIQTRDGYLWMATYDGLVRFDGVRFTVFKSSTTEGLPSNRIVDLLESRDGSLWIRTTQNHLIRFENHIFTSFDPAYGPQGQLVSVLFEGADGTLWIGTDQGVSQYRDGRFVPFKPGLIRGYVLSLLVDHSGALWIGTESRGLMRWQDGHIESWTTEHGLTSNKVNHIFEAPDSTVWVATDSSLHYFRNGTLHRLSPHGRPWSPEGEIRRLFAGASPEELWIGTRQGLFVYREGTVTSVISEEESHFHVKALVRVGPDGHVWTSMGNRVFRNGHLIYAAPSEIVAMHYDTEGSLWLATSRSGLHQLKPVTFTTYGVPEGLAHGNVYSVYEDQSGALWFGTFGGGASRLQDGRFTHHNPESGLPCRFVLSFAEDRERSLWLGGICGLFRFREGRFERPPP